MSLKIHVKDIEYGDYKSYECWKEYGLSVRKGEKSFKRSPEGVALFHKDQVEDPYEEYYTEYGLPDQF